MADGSRYLNVFSGKISIFREGVREVMAPGVIDAFTKEMLSELMTVVGMACQTNTRANGFQIEVDDVFHKGGRDSR